MDQTRLTVAAVESVGPDAVAIDFDSPAEFSARPGQFVKLTFELGDEPESRFYTISSPDTDDTFEITVGIDPEGAVGPLLADLEPGDEVLVSGPFGSSYYEDESRVVVLAGGPGVGPAVGIGERALADGHDVAVVYQDDSPLHEERLAALESEGAFVDVLDADGDVASAVADALAAAGDDAQVFVYGFADFLDIATDAIEAAGGKPDAAKVENFG